MISELPRSTRTEPLFPYTTRFRSVREGQPTSKPSNKPAYRALDQTAASDPADDGGAISCRCDRASLSAAGDGSGAGADEALHRRRRHLHAQLTAHSKAPDHEPRPQNHRQLPRSLHKPHRQRVRAAVGRRSEEQTSEIQYIILNYTH